MRNNNLEFARWWMIAIGIVLAGAGVLGFMPNPLVGRPDSILPTDRMHDTVHIVTGVVAIVIGLALRGSALVNATLAFGVLYLLIFVAMVVSPDMFGMFTVPANIVVHVVHAVVAFGSLAIGYLARTETDTDVDRDEATADLRGRY